mgnify:FL=1
MKPGWFMNAGMKFGVMGLLLVLLSACTSNVVVDYDRDTRFSAYKSYMLLPKSVESTKDKRLDSPFIDRRVVQAIQKNMAARGFTYSESSPDMKIEYQIDLKHEVASDGSGVTMLIGGGSGGVGMGFGYAVPSSDVASHEVGRITIDMKDAANGKLLWRGSSSQRLRDPSKPEDSEAFVNEVVGEIIGEFPPN